VFIASWIRPRSTLRLARVRRVAPKPMLAEDARGSLDLETVRAVIMNRYYVLRDYSRIVMLPAIRQELRDRGTSVMRRARRLLIREPALLDERHESTLDDLLENHRVLDTLYQYRERLKEIWQTTLPNDQLLARFREWIAQAEASGIRQLQEFAERLRAYRMPATA
jgi:stearoyl-CoA desaturase (Delta-9 desaturase)